MLGWLALAVGAASLSSWLAPWLLDRPGIGSAFGTAVSLGLAMPAVALVAVLINPRALKDRSGVPVVALVLGVMLGLGFIFVISQLAGLGNMR
jgi:hypothetical protein